MSVGNDKGAELLPPPARRRSDDSSYDSSGKTPQQIENDITQTRAELGEILDAIERKVAPRYLLERGMDMFKDRMSGREGGVAETLRDHPVPLALIGIGVGWILMSATGRSSVGSSGALRERVSGAVRSASERATDFAKQAQEKVTGALQGASSEPYPTESAGYAYARQKPTAKIAKTARGAASAAGDVIRRRMRRAQRAGTSAWEQAGDYAGEAGQRLQRMRDRAADLVEERPFALATVGFLAGALIALMLPRTRLEEQLASTSGAEQLREQATNLGRQAVERAQQAAQSTADAAIAGVSSVIGGKEEKT